MNRPLKIVVTGPECTGKTRLCSALSEKFGEPWVPEFAVHYLNQMDRPYKSDDLLRIAKGQLASIAQKEQESENILIIDTGLEVIDIWHRDKLGIPPPEFQRLLLEWSPDLYLLCKPDIPYEAHPLREDPYRRDALFERYIEKLEAKSTAIVSGSFSDRMGIACRTIGQLLDERQSLRGIL